MNQCIVRECLERVARVTRGWADDKTLSAPLRHMSRHVHELAVEVGRRKDLCSTSVRNVESRFCLMCRRVKAGSGECPQRLEQCQLLKHADFSGERVRIVNLGLLDPAPAAGADPAGLGSAH